MSSFKRSVPDAVRPRSFEASWSTSARTFLALVQRVGERAGSDRLDEASVDLGWRAEGRGVADEAPTLRADRGREDAMLDGVAHVRVSAHHAKLSGWRSAMSSVIAPRSCTLPMLNALSE